MSSFIVSFRIEKDSTYQDRYDSLRDRVNAITAGVVWDETTSVYIFRANGTVSTVAHDLYINTQINATKDTLLVVDPIRGEYKGYGIQYPALLDLAIGIKKVA